ncbi:hypothetical protein KCV07_g10108, partial [Aureobasidium melanogenum]
MLGFEILRWMSPRFLQDNVNVDTVHWNFVQYKDNATTLDGTERALMKAIGFSLTVEDRSTRQPKGLVANVCGRIEAGE